MGPREILQPTCVRSLRPVSPGPRRWRDAVTRLSRFRWADTARGQKDLWVSMVSDEIRLCSLSSFDFDEFALVNERR